MSVPRRSGCSYDECTVHMRVKRHAQKSAPRSISGTKVRGSGGKGCVMSNKPADHRPADPDTFREPQRGFDHVEVPAPAPQPWPRAERPLEVRVVGAGRELGLTEFLDVTSSTSCVVVVDG